MRRILALMGTLFCLILVACGEDQVLCPPIASQAVAVDVRDSLTDGPVVSAARGAVFLAGILDDSLRRDRVFSLFPDSVLVGGKSEGQVEVRVEHPDYLPWTTSVQTHLSGGECPTWETQPLTARLQQ
ncbi:MAG TPA: hypothetical protein VIM84_04005 [Gemmatimonadales bacterium]